MRQLEIQPPTHLKRTWGLVINPRNAGHHPGKWNFLSTASASNKKTDRDYYTDRYIRRRRSDVINVWTDNKGLARQYILSRWLHARSVS